MRALVSIIAAVLLASGLAPAAVAEPAPPVPALEAVERRVDHWHEEAERATEQYNEAREKLASLTVRASAARALLARQHRLVREARGTVGRLAAETYRRGEVTTLDVMLSDDPRAYLAQSGYLPSLGAQRSGALRKLMDGERRLAELEQQVATQERAARATQQRMRLNRDAVLGHLANAEAELARLRAAERAELSWRRLSRATFGVPGGGGRSWCEDLASAADARVRAVIAFACQQIGDPYVWAAEGPGSWDCSGLTMLAWQQAGISLPHSSRVQATYGTRVSFAEMQPGDLVFFHSPISHVGIALGGGLMIHAPRTGDVVRIARIWTMPSAVVRL